MTEEQYQTALNNIAETFGTLRDQVSSAFQSGRALGLNDVQIGNDVRSRIKGLVSTKTIQNILPQTAKHMQHASKHKSEPVNFTGSYQPRLIVPEEPKIPPRPQVMQELEPEPPKAINEPIPISFADTEIMLDTGKFRSDLRIALINGAKVRLRINNRNEVISMKE
jgi:hypothetical protein